MIHLHTPTPKGNKRRCQIFWSSYEAVKTMVLISNSVSQFALKDGNELVSFLFCRKKQRILANKNRLRRLMQCHILQLLVAHLLKRNRSVPEDLGFASKLCLL